MNYNLQTMEVVVTIQTKFQPIKKTMIVSGSIKFDSDTVYESSYDAELHENKNRAFTNFQEKLHEKAGSLLRELL